MMDLRRLRPTWAEIDLDAIAHNTRELRRLANPGARLMAVVKADGYGHGAERVARAAVAAGADWLGVAILEEALALRQAGIAAPIHVLGYLAPGQADTAAVYDLNLTVYDLESAAALDQWGRALGRPVPVHVKVDTGMGRLGLPPQDVLPYVQRLQGMAGLRLAGIFTHFASADEADAAYTNAQFATFQGVLQTLQAQGIDVPLRHAANSAATLRHPATHLDLVRCGIALYGLRPAAAVAWPADLRPALAWKTRVSHLKTVAPGTAVSYGRTYTSSAAERIATLPVGYADGYSRRLSNAGRVVLGGVVCPVVGRVCMDQTLVRLPADLPAKVGDEAVLLGSQDGASVTADDLAAQLGTINYEVVCAVGRRVPRVYRQNGEWSQQTAY